MQQHSNNQDLYPSRITPEAKIVDRKDPVFYGKDAAQAPGALTPELVNQYEKNGFLFFEKLFSTEEIALFRSELERLSHSEQLRKSAEVITEPQRGELRSIFRVHHLSELFRALSSDTRVLEIVQFLLDSPVYIHQSRVNCKPGFQGKEFYWHSDFETWHIEDGMPRMRAISC